MHILFNSTVLNHMYAKIAGLEGTYAKVKVIEGL